MSMSQQIAQPVRVSELLGISKNSANSEKKRHEPVKIKELLASCSKSGSFTKDRGSRKTVGDSKSCNNPVRRQLYGKLNSQRQSPNKNNTAASSRAKILATKSPRVSRKSLLPPPNSIVQKHIRQAINDNRPCSTIIEERTSEINNLSGGIIQRPTVIKNAILQCSENKNGDTIMNKSITIPTLIITEAKEMTTVNDDELEVNVADKENIPPPLDLTDKPLTEHNAQQSNSADHHLLDLCQNMVMLLSRLNLNMVEIKSQQAQQTDILRKMYTILSDKFQKSVTPVSEVSSSPHILTEVKSELNRPKSDYTNSEKKKRRHSKKGSNQQQIRRSSGSSKKSPGKDDDDSFVALENELNINEKSTSKRSPVIKTPKTTIHRLSAKSERPLREYLAMKASMSFLETPEPNGFRRRIDSSNTPQGTKSSRKSISNKLFDELQDLYCDSPGPVPLCQYDQ